MSSQICYRFDDVCIRIFNGKEVSISDCMCQNLILLIVMGSSEFGLLELLTEQYYVLT